MTMGVRGTNGGCRMASREHAVPLRHRCTVKQRRVPAFELATRHSRLAIRVATSIPSYHLCSMAEQDQTYDDGRAHNLEAMLRALADRIGELDRQGRLLSQAGE